MRLLAILCLIVAFLPYPLFASDNKILNESEVDERISFLETKLSDIQTPSKVWQYGWTGIYGVSGAAQLFGAIDEDNSDDSTALYVGAGKSVAALAMLLTKPLPVIDGWDEYEAMANNTLNEKLTKLEVAENILEQSSLRADRRYTWKPHLLNIGLNLLGAGIIVAFGDSDDALGSAALGLAAGEAAIWTEPTLAQEHWKSYQQRYSLGEQSAFSWRIFSSINHVALQVTF